LLEASEESSMPAPSGSVETAGDEEESAI